MRRMQRWTLLAAATAMGLMAVREAVACGPYATTALFTDIGTPDTEPKAFAAGQLGIVRPTFSKENLVIAYRHLEGWGLDDEAQAAVATAPEVDNGGPGPEPDRWLKARAAVVGGEAPKLDPFTQLKEFNSYVRIPAGAFTHAVSKVDELSKTHGLKSAEVLEWVRGQDQVFASIAAAPAIPAALKGPDWLRVERQYQIAAALFYAEKFDDARKAFYAISLDKNSPWQPWGAYLQARCWVREATLRPLHGDPADKAPLRSYRQAQTLLEGLLKTVDLPGDLQEAAAAYRDLVRHQTEPGRLRDEALAQLAAPKPGADFRPAMARLLSAEKCLKSALASPSARLDSRAEGLRIWLEVFDVKATTAPGTSLLSEAKRSPAMLVAALDRLPPGHADEKALVALAAKVPAASPAYPSLQWQLLWRELGFLAPAAQKARLESALQRKDLPVWALNRLRNGRRGLAVTLEEWTPFAPSFVVATEVENEVEPALPDKTTGLRPQLFAGVEGTVINQSLTLDQLLVVAKQPGLAKPVAAEVARCAWMRAMVLERMDRVHTLTPLLESALQERASGIENLVDPVERRFEAVRLMMGFPGLRFDIGTDYTTRVNSTDPKEFDSLRDNWWCGPDPEKAKPLEAGPNPGFLKSADLQQALLDRQALAKVPAAQIYFAQAALAFAEAHPDDARVPEALHRVVATTRAPMCGSAEMTALSKRCFNLLHKRYAKSEWTAKTKYYF